MKTIIRRDLCMLYSILIGYNIVLVYCQISSDSDPGTMNNIQYSELQLQDVPSVMEASGDTTETSTSNTTSTTNGPFDPNNCSNTSYVQLTNNTCILKSDAVRESVSIIRGNSSNSTVKADALLEYFSSTTNLTITPNIPNTLTPREIDELINELTGDIIRKWTSLFIMVSPTANGTIGGSSERGLASQIVTNTTKTQILNSNILAAAIISDKSAEDIDSITVFILRNSTAYENLDLSDNKSLASSVITAAVQRKENLTQINISLYFTVINNRDSHTNGRYICSFFDTNTSIWNESGCNVPQYNETYDRYECTCNHLTTFALIWLPNTPQTNYLTAQDIASLIFLSISILCFIAVIIHSITIRFLNPIMSLRARDLLPLISSASTTILFIFYIALTMTVFTQTTSQNERRCFLSSSVLMFFVYFFLIFMFCIKTSVGYFNYLRFVHLFPEPSHRKLFLLLIISFFISITWTLFAAGFNSNSSYNITQLHGNKLCWFTRDVIYYFLTIPACIFLLLNFITVIFVTKHIINHVRRATSPHQSYERMKRCVIIILSSCITQGIGWLFGPFISIINPTAGDILGWFFIVFNGLEGVWSILLYMIIRFKRIDERKRVLASKQREDKTSLKSMKRKKKQKDSGLNTVLARRFRVTHRNARKQKLIFDDLYNQETTYWKTRTYEL